MMINGDKWLLITVKSLFLINQKNGDFVINSDDITFLINYLIVMIDKC